ncbi:hypothetical protein ABZY09_46660 [Streptomyces sp. NPDC002928]|uniref:hypothetical protein n=1 Tax=Streptomyces sp. NPDC002928 TaxID=3154440 RepID=UPI0033B0412D
MPVDGRRVVVSAQVRRLICPVLGCSRQTFRERGPGLLERYERRTARLSGQLGYFVKELAGRAGALLSRCLAVVISRSTALRMLTRARQARPLSRLSLPRPGVVAPKTLPASGCSARAGFFVSIA